MVVSLFERDRKLLEYLDRRRRPPGSAPGSAVGAGRHGCAVRPPENSPGCVRGAENLGEGREEVRKVRTSRSRPLLRLRVVIRVLAVQLRSARAVGHDSQHVVLAQRLHGASHVVESGGADLDHQDGAVRQRGQQVGVGRKQQRRRIENRPVEAARQFFEQRLAPAACSAVRADSSPAIRPAAGTDSCPPPCAAPARRCTGRSGNRKVRERGRSETDCGRWAGANRNRPAKPSSPSTALPPAPGSPR